MDTSMYEKQLKWRDEAKQRAIAARQSETEDTECTFTPRIYSVPVKKFTGPAKELNDKSGVTHVRRQASARKEKSELKKEKIHLALPSELEHSNNTKNNSATNIQSGMNNIEHDFDHEDEGADEESLVEMFERERKEWHTERLKLVHCIHLQQLELTQRAAAATEQAATIAKEFARAIEGFEERLVLIETNVQKELMVIKTVAEKLGSHSHAGAVSGAMSNTAANNEERLKTLESGVNTILQKLETIQLSVGNHNVKK